MKRNLFIGLSLLTGVPMAAQQKQQEHPNLIFVITDQLRNDVFGCRGDEIAKTPISIALNPKVRILRMRLRSRLYRQRQELLFLPENTLQVREWSSMSYV